MLMTKRAYFTMGDCGVTAAEIELTLGYGDAYSEQLSKYIYGKYEGNWVIYKDEEDAIKPDDAKITRWKNKLRLKYDLTKEKYETLLGYYAAYKSRLMDRIGSKTAVRFNDTPQNAGDFSSESYTTTYTETSHEADDKDNMAKLSEIQTLYDDVFASWLEEFKTLFGEEIE